MPKICHLITGLSVGGAEQTLYNLLNGGLRDHFQHHVVSLGGEGAIGPRIRALQVPVTALDMRGGWRSVRGVMNLRRLIRKERPDLLQGWMYHGNAAATLARRFAPEGSSLVWNVRQTLYDLRNEKLMTRQIIRANSFFSSVPEAVLYNSYLSRKQHEAFGFRAEQGQVIPNGINVQRFIFAGEGKQRVRSGLSIPPDTKVVGHVARLHPMKDHASFLGAAKKVADAYSEVHFLLVGRDVCPETREVIRLVPDRLRDRFHFLGERNDIPALMSAMDIFCLSSAWGEGFPNVLGEAMATGLPCVTTDIGDSAMIVGDTGVVVPPRDTVALAAGIDSLLALSRENLRIRGASAREHIERNYTLGSIVEIYGALYEKLLTRKGVR